MEANNEISISKVQVLNLENLSDLEELESIQAPCEPGAGIRRFAPCHNHNETSLAGMKRCKALTTVWRNYKEYSIKLTTVLMALAVGLSGQLAFGQTIQACRDNTNGNLRQVTSSADCRTNETYVTWNAQGPTRSEERR